MAEKTLILVKPDAFARNLTGEILARFERKGLTIEALKLVTTPRETAETHYAEHAERPFFGELVDFITVRPARGRDPVRQRRDQGCSAADRRDEPARGRYRLDPR